MPTYTFRDAETGDVFDVMMTLSDYDEYKKQHPLHERYFDGAPSLISGSSLKTDNGFKEVLSRVAEAHPTSPLANQTLSKSIKQSQTDRAVTKWRSQQT